MANQNNSTFGVGEHVFVKLKGFPQWPAVITEIIDIKNQTKYKVSFFGDHQTGIIKKSDLHSYKEHKHTFGQLRTDNFKNKGINQALKEAELSFNNWQDRNKKNSLKDMETSINEIEDKIQNNHDADLETSLSLAAEAGNVLLAENNLLKQDLHRMTLKNSQLAKKLVDSAKLDEMKYQIQIEELIKENENLIHRNITLSDTICQLENQLHKEKELRCQLELTFEEQDQEKEKAICQYEKEVSQLRENLRHLKTENIKNNDKEIIDNKGKNNAATQTNNTIFETAYNPCSLLTQFVQMKIRQDEMEKQMTIIQEKLEYKEKQNPISIEGLGIKNNNNPRTEETQLSRNRVKQPYLKIQNKELSANNKKLKTTTPKITTSDCPSIRTYVTSKRRKSLYSVSLQMVKSKAEMDKTRQSSSSHLDAKLTHPVNLSFHKKPPITAKTRDKNETVENFFEKYLEHYKIINKCYLSHHSKTENLKKNLTPLEDNQSLIGRDSQTPSKKLTLLDDISIHSPPSYNIGQQILVQAEVHRPDSFLEHTNMVKSRMKTSKLWNVYTNPAEI